MHTAYNGASAWVALSGGEMLIVVDAIATGRKR